MCNSFVVLFETDKIINRGETEEVHVETCKPDLEAIRKTLRNQI